MGIRKNTLWRVPLYCMAAGILSVYPTVRMLVRFAVMRLPDGTVTVDGTRRMMVYGVVFAAFFPGGAVFFRHMTRQKIFLSATLIVCVQMMIVLTQWRIGPVSGPYAKFFLYAAEISGWCRFVSELVYQVTGNLWMGAFLENLTPYLFVLCGRKRLLENG